MKQLINEIKAKFEIEKIHRQRENLCFLTIKKEQLVSFLTYLRDIKNYTHLVMVTVVDWLENEQFQLTYLLHNYNENNDIGIKVMLDRNKPEMESIHHLWKQGRVYQRELHEMFGIDFPGSPGVLEPMILEGWQEIPPMRRDFDTKKYSDETYSHRPRENYEPEQYMKEKLYPED
jgi:NADH-quinone oxidoreductase subunit C